MFLLAMGTPVREILILLVVVVLIVSISGIVMTATSPTMIAEKTSVLSYEHNGSFDYTIYLKPSYLYGSSSDQLATSSKYPVSLVDTINFVFTYNALNEGEADVWVNAVLRNSDIWSKVIELNPMTSTKGLTSIQFSLNPSEINEIYDTIQQETGISATIRSVNIEAHIKTNDKYFTHSLPITLSNTIIEIGSNLVSSFHTGTTEFSYLVNLKPNSVFDTTTLVPSPSSAMTTILGPGEIIISNLVDKMLLDYCYQFETNGPVEQLNIDLELKAILEAPDIWMKEFPLLHQDSNGDLNISTVIDLGGYFQSLAYIRAETGIPVDSYNLTIKADIHVSAKTPFGSINDTFVQSMIGTINSGIITWESPLTASQTGDILSTQIVLNPKAIFGLSIASARILFPITSIVSIIIVSLLVTSHFLTRRYGLSDTEQAMLHIMKKYGNRIIEATVQKPAIGERAISLVSIDSLINIADELGKLVIHESPVKRNQPHAYYVFDGATRYRYLLGGYQVEKEDDDIQIELTT